jgi:hypothetical protein
MANKKRRQKRHPQEPEKRVSNDRLVKPFSLIGSVEILGDLEAASKEIAAEWDQALERSAKELESQLA